MSSKWEEGHAGIFRRIGSNNYEYLTASGANALESRITQLEADLAKLATHAGHYGNCPLSSWDKRLTKCACGLFQVLSRLTPSPESSEAVQ